VGQGPQPLEQRPATADLLDPAKPAGALLPPEFHDPNFAVPEEVRRALEEARRAPGPHGQAPRGDSSTPGG
jgi:hypothetical protein